MPQFTLPNTATGGTITVTAADLPSAQRAAAGQTGVPLQQQQGGGTYGVNTGGGVGTTGGTNTGGGGGVPYGGDLSGLAQFGAQTSGVTQAQLAQQKQEFDAQLQFARDQMQQLGIPQLQINQTLAQLQQQQFQAQLALAAQQQQYTQAATNAGLTGWLYPTAPVPNVSQFTGPLSNQGGGTSWNTLSNYMQQQAGNNYNDQAAKTAYAQAIGTTPNNLPGNVGQNLSQAQLSAIMQAGGVPQSAIAGAVGNQTNGVTGPGIGQGAMIQATGPGGAPNPNLPMQTLAGAAQQATLSGMYQGAPTEAAREFNQQLALGQGQLGQQYLATAAQLQGPQNLFQLANYMQGAQGNPNVPLYLQNLTNNVRSAAFQQSGNTPPTLQSAAGLIGQMANTGGQTNPSGYAQGGNPFTQTMQSQQNAAGGQGGAGQTQYGGSAAGYGGYGGYGGGGAQAGGANSATPGWNMGQTQNALRGMMQAGAQSLGPGSLESLSSDQLAAFGSGLGSVGGSLPSFLQQYANSRVGQQAPVAQARLT